MKLKVLLCHCLYLPVHLSFLLEDNPSIPIASSLIFVNNSQDCLQRIVSGVYIYELVSGEDGSLHVAWHSGKVFRKADSLINLARDALEADVKKPAIHLYLGCHTTSCK